MKMSEYGSDRQLLKQGAWDKVRELHAKAREEANEEEARVQAMRPTDDGLPTKE